MGTEKVYFASKPVEGTSKDHLYLYYDPDADGDGDPTTGAGMKIIRGGPQNAFGTAAYLLYGYGDVVVEAGVDAESSKDKFEPGETAEDRNFTEAASGAGAGTLWDNMVQSARDLGTYNSSTNESQMGIGYGPVGPNSNATVRSIAESNGIDFYGSLPIDSDTDEQMGPSDFPGSAAVFGTTGDDVYDLTDTPAGNGASVVYDTGGADIYKINPDITTWIVEDNDPNTTDRLVIEGVDPLDASYERRGNDLIIYGTPNGGRPIAIIKDHFGPGGPKINYLDFDDGSGPVSIPTSGLNPPQFLPKPLVPFVSGVLDGFEDAQGAPIPVGGGSPLVLDLDGDGVELTALNAPGSVYWDIDVDGFAEATGWTTGGDGLLAIDLNADGYINDHSELFGDQTGSANGFIALAGYDSNTDGYITGADTQYGDLLVWVDSNADGYSQSAELHTLTSLGITSIDLGYSTVSYTISGHEIKQESAFTINGNTRAIVDAWFNYDNVNSVYAENYTLDVRTLFLPTLRGYGDLPDLHVAMSLDEDLLEMVQDFVVGNDLSEMAALAYNPFDVNGALQAILFKWAGVDGVNPTSRGPTLDARILEFLEVLVGADFLQAGSPDPWYNAGPILLGAWKEAYQAFASRIIFQAAGLNDIFEGGGAYNPATDTFENASTLDFDAIHSHLLGAGDWIEQVKTSIFVVAMIDDAIGIENLSSQDRDNLQAVMPTGVPIESVDHLLMGSGSFSGDAEDSVILASSSSDSFYGLGGNDVLVGGDGLDSAYGGTGNDTYQFNLGDGSDINNADQVVEYLNEGTDTIVFGAGIDAEGVYAWTESAGNLVINYGAAEDLIRIAASQSGGASLVASHLERMIFADGTTWDLTAGLHIKNNDTGRYLYGSNNNDTIEGGAAGDTFYGYGGNDTYIFDPGDGDNAYNPEYLYETLGGGTDTVVFGAGIEVEDVYAWTESNGNLIINYGSADDLIRVVASHSAGVSLAGSYLEQIVFADSTTWDLTAGLHLRADAAGRYLYGSNNNDIFESGTGGDAFYGYGGNDTYIFNIGSGFNAYNAEHLYENLSAGSDTMIFGAGIDPENVYAWTDYSGDLTIKYGTDDLVIIHGGVVGGSTPNASAVASYLEQIVFADATTWDLTAGLHLRNDNTSRTLYGSNGGDTIEGGAGWDTLYGYNGNDLLLGGDSLDNAYGGAGNDTYVFNSGDGLDAYNADHVYEDLSAGADIVAFGAGIDAEGVYVWTDSSGNLTIKYGATDLVTIHGGVAGGSTPNASTVGSYVEQIAFADSTTWDLTAGLHLKNNDSGRSLYGSNYADTIVGGASTDTLYGYDGADVLYGGSGTDTLAGGNGADTFAWLAAHVDGSLDTISDFSAANGDKIDISDVLDLYDPLNDLLSDYVKITEGTSSTTFWVDAAGTGTFGSANDFVTLTGVTNILAGGSGSVSTETDLQNLVANGTLIAA